MNASKEEAIKALETLERLTASLAVSLNTARRTPRIQHFIALQDFLDAAYRKLPSEAALAKDKSRRKAKKA